jgi:hypothetical protein
LKSPFTFKKYGQSGIEVSELFSHTAECIDEIAVVRSMHALSNNHTPAILQMMTGFIQPGRPSVGSWTTYGLGSENQNLPALLVLMDNVGPPLGGAQIGALASFLVFTRELRSATKEIALSIWHRRNLSKPSISAVGWISFKMLNDHHVARHPEEGGTGLAGSLPMSCVPLAKPGPQKSSTCRKKPRPRISCTAWTTRLWHFGRNCILARRLVEKGVRFVQLYGGGMLQNRGCAWYT